MKPSTILKKARKLIERGWTKAGWWADKHGREVGDKSKVCRVCNGGALHFVTGLYNSPAHEYLFRANGGEAVITYSTTDGASKRKSLGFFDRAIKLAISEGQ